MNRGVWFVAGVASGVYGVVRARRVAESLTAEGVKDRALALAHGARMFRDEVAQGAAERETELRPRFGLGSAEGEPRRLAAAPDLHAVDTATHDRTPRKEH